MPFFPTGAHKQYNTIHSYIHKIIKYITYIHTYAHTHTIIIYNKKLNNYRLDNYNIQEKN